ncbi:ExeM/NucH family extracellular endonuclease [Brumicola nitratireducens]|uniref:Endonuclease/exonuclease/phosphatase n=1 Tax=Glaciecola nitratireducens (strain JCM 12485 / KCTC 12276 / FR1064) TaxID=1085623 RepID=G4QIZ1_GLANF|nr:ExeM/NucH family extracellular endonuclease [Glaciecola nitratireducens]AEP28330.1 Endonuclease/exonuclease/phosphatase [Glaciecola nitratireducens FR1064]
MLLKHLLPAASLSMIALGFVHADETTIAYDMVSSSSLNLIEYQNPYTNAFSSAADGFQKYQRGVSSSIPFSVLDDTTTFSSDSIGIVASTNTEEFFGIVDTVNADTTDEVVASWVFDISGETELGLQIDMGAMGDFESSDVFKVTASIDGDSEVELLRAVADESADLSYTLESGKVVSLNDPLVVNGTVLSNVFKPLRAPILGTGSELTIRLTAKANGGTEAFAVQNLKVLKGFVNESPLGPETVAISFIQGTGNATQVNGLDVRIEGIVVGDFQRNDSIDNGDLRGFFVQSEVGDGNPLTSEALFVFDNSNPDVDVTIGDRVSVTGSVSEFGGMTQVSASTVTVLANDQALPVAQVLNLPIIDDLQLEALEGMRIVIPQELVIGDYFNFDRFGEIGLTLPLGDDKRLNTPTAVVDPDSNEYFDLLAANAARRILLDDGRTTQNPDPAIHPNGQEFTLDNRFRGGDTVTNVQGIMHQSFGAYRIQPTQGADYVATNPRTSAPETAGRLKVVSFNVLNYFTTLDQFGNSCGPALLSCRGADTAEEFERQRSKIIQALKEINADVVGLIEIENNPEAAVKDLADGINAAIGEEVYGYVDTGTIGTDAIKVAILYKKSALSLAGDFAILDSVVDPRFIDTKNRPALAQTFEENQAGGRVTVVVNHFKSKGSDCEEFGDFDVQDGQGNCNLVRTDAAKALADWLATDPTGSDDPDYLIIGDLNSYDKEDPIVALQASGFVDMVKQFGGEKAYSYVFDSQVGYLDYALATSVLAQQVTAVSIWSINADEPDILDYDTSFKATAQDALFAPDAYRSSDHDPVIVGLDLYIVPRDKNQCKKDGWKDLRRNDGSMFRNQGRCVSYVNTGK